MKKILSVIAFSGCILAHAQTENVSQVEQQFAAFGNRNVQEKLFVHTDKEFYLAGEIIWYKLYYVDGINHHPIDLSKVAYIEILDQNNKPVMQGKNALKNSAGKGSFYLPSSVNSGNYKLRAYTAWMKNFDAGYFFEKNLTIVNSFKSLNLPAAPPAIKYQAGFYPEGGNFVAGIENRIAFNVTDQYGKGQVASGAVISDKNDTVASFNTLKFGMGNFSFTPEAGHTYKAVIQLEGAASFNSDLPILNTSGYNIKVEESSEIINVTVKTTFNAPEEVFILAHTRQVTRYAEKKILSNGTASFSFPKSKLDDGVSQITIFNRDQRPVAERLVFKAPSKKLDIAASIGSATASTVKSREAVTVG
ncbi:MAG: hypothetical protein EOO02_17260, partial [Chitinophagaceae bacterium]